MRKVPLTLARKNLDKFVKTVSLGDPLIITRRGIEVAALVPSEKADELAALRDMEKPSE